MSEATLTDRQRDIYVLIRSLIQDRGYGPTVREIGAQMGIRSPNGVMSHLRALERKGLITRRAGKSRAIQLIDNVDARRGRLPMLGVVSDRTTTLDFSTKEVTQWTDRLDGHSDWVVRVSGNGLDKQHVVDGDYLVFRRSETARAGQLVLLTPRIDADPGDESSGEADMPSDTLGVRLAAYEASMCCSEHEAIVGVAIAAHREF